MAHGITSTGYTFPDATTQTTAASNSQVTTTTVLNALAGASGGAVGSYAILQRKTNLTLGASNPVFTTVAGSNYWFGNISGGVVNTGTAPTGTWRLIGPQAQSVDTYAGTVYSETTVTRHLALRIS